MWRDLCYLYFHRKNYVLLQFYGNLMRYMAKVLEMCVIFLWRARQNRPLAESFYFKLTHGLILWQEQRVNWQLTITITFFSRKRLESDGMSKETYLMVEYSQVAIEHFALLPLIYPFAPRDCFLEIDCFPFIFERQFAFSHNTVNFITFIEITGLRIV